MPRIVLPMAMLWIALHAAGAQGGPPTCEKDQVFAAGDPPEWIVDRQDPREGGGTLQEEPFQLVVDGEDRGTACLLAIFNRFGTTDLVPQIAALAPSGFLRLKSGLDTGDPETDPKLGQSLVTVPAIWGSIDGVGPSTLFYSPQVQRVEIDSSGLDPEGRGDLLIEAFAGPEGLPAETQRTNRVLDLSWTIELREPSGTEGRADVTARYVFGENLTLDPVRTGEAQSFRLIQISSMFISKQEHDVDAVRYLTSDGGVFELFFRDAPQGVLLLTGAPDLSPSAPILDSIHSDDVGEPNGNTPSYRLELKRIEGPTAGPLRVRGFITPTEDRNQDNLSLWIHQEAASPMIAAGTSGLIEYTLTATNDPLALEPPANGASSWVGYE